MNRMRRLLLLTLAGSPLWAWLPTAGAAPNGTRGGRDGALQITLRELLAKGLKARRPQEFAFVDRVVAEVNAGRLSRKQVERVFAWARQQQRYPFQYFQFAMVKEARRVGVRL